MLSIPTKNIKWYDSVLFSIAYFRQSHLILTETSLTSLGILAWISNWIYVKQYRVITRQFP